MMSLLTLGLLMNLAPAQENRYGFSEKQPPAQHLAAPQQGKVAKPQGDFWQRFRQDLKTTGRQLGKAFNRTREELSYSYHTSTTKFPRHNTLNRHQKRFQGHVRTRNEARSTPYRKPLTSEQRNLPAPANLSSGNRQQKGRVSTLPPHPPLEIVAPQQPPAQRPLTNRPPASKEKPVSKQPPAIKPPVKKEASTPANSTPPPPKKNSDTNASTKLTVTENKTKPEPEPESIPAKKESKPAYPFATKTEKPGYVKSPYPPFALLDVTGIKPGGLAMEPDSDRIFRVPE